MYKLKLPDGKTVLTEKPNFVQIHSNGKTFILCDRKEAEGIVYQGKAYRWDDGVYVQEIDGGKEFDAITATMNALLMGEE